MTLIEFSIACKLINLKLRGFEVPKQIPPTLLSSLTTAGGTPIMTPPGQMSPLIFNRPPPVPAPPVIPPQPVAVAPVLPGVASGLTSPIQAQAVAMAMSPPGAVAAAPAPMNLLIQAKKPSGTNLLDSLEGAASDLTLLTNGAAPKPPSQPGTRSGSISEATAIPYEAK